jgi:hypothetical protein
MNRHIADFLIIAIAAVSLSLVACAPGPEPAGDVSGTWSESWSCEETCGGSTETTTGTVEMTLTQDGANVTRVDDDGTEWSGTLSGLELSLSTSSDDYSEDSTFTFDDGLETFTVDSTYTWGECTGVCTGTGERSDG